MKLRLCFLWHMHQPYYKDPDTGTYILPWVRLHAIKDYVALPRIFREFPKVRHTFNMVPSLLIQVRDYVENGAEDVYLTLSRKNALDLDRTEEEFLIRNFFSAFPPTMILPQPRYKELYHRQGQALAAVGKAGAPGGFGASELTDLATLFNLTWFHPMHREEDAELTRLWEKGRDFTDREKNYVLDRQLDVMATLIPEYRKLVEEDGGELSSTPMYHPILPLLIDNRAARDAHPDAALPGAPFAWPEDARAQLEKGREVFRTMFGGYPTGLWPSEGSVSPAAIEMAARTGFRWSATDEVLLARVLRRTIHRDANGVPADPDILYRPWRARTPGGDVAMFFRDHHLSDRIGFEYSRWDAVDAANNFVHIVGGIYDKLSSIPSGQRREEYVVPVILDGENAWEYFYDSGRLFLRTLMNKLGGMNGNIQCTTYTSALDACASSMEDLPAVPTGSWIDGTFYIWIGHEEDRASWDMLTRARRVWDGVEEQSRRTGVPTPEEMTRAKEHLYVAEGSDWCWWYGDDHYTPHGADFDALFRHHVKAAYKVMGVRAPDNVDIPILKASKMPSGKNFLPSPRTYIHPIIDGQPTSYFEWSAATRYVPMPEYGAMHRAGFGMLTSMCYGFDRSRLYFRVDLHPSLLESRDPFTVELLFPLKNRKFSVRIDPGDKEAHVMFSFVDPPAQREGLPEEVARSGAAAFDRILEISIPFASLGCEEDEKFEFFLTLQAQVSIGERWPMYGTFTADLPGGDFEQRMWEI